MIETILRDLRQPEYIHVLLNPLPLYGLVMGWIGLLIALLLRSRPAKIATLTLILISAAAAWPVYEFGEQGYDRVLSMTDDDSQGWLDEHQRRAEQLIYFFYALAILSAAAIAAPIKWPKSSVLLAIAVLLFGAVVLGMGCYIAYAGGKIRHREFRNEPPPKKKTIDVSLRSKVWDAQAASLPFASACRECLLKKSKPQSLNVITKAPGSLPGPAS